MVLYIGNIFSKPRNAGNPIDLQPTAETPTIRSPSHFYSEEVESSKIEDLNNWAFSLPGSLFIHACSLKFAFTHDLSTWELQLISLGWQRLDGAFMDLMWSASWSRFWAISWSCLGMSGVRTHFVGPKSIVFQRLFSMSWISLLFDIIPPLICHFEHSQYTLLQSTKILRIAQALKIFSCGWKFVKSKYQTPMNFQVQALDWPLNEWGFQSRAR